MQKGPVRGASDLEVATRRYEGRAGVMGSRRSRKDTEFWFDTMVFRS